MSSIIKQTTLGFERGSFRSASAFSFCFWRSSLILFKNSRFAEYGRGMLNLASTKANTVQALKNIGISKLVPNKKSDTYRKEWPSY